MKLKKKFKKGNSKSSPTLRPRRRASQTYFFKYQLARNPLKAEEEDLKIALLASLQQCDDDTPKEQLQEQLKRQQLIYENHLKNHKQPKKVVQSNHHQQPSKQQKQKHPPPQKTVVQNNNSTPPAYDEEYLKRYRPETEDFLTFICFQISAQNYTLPQQHNELTTVPTASGSVDHLSNNMKPLNGYISTSTTTGIHVKINNDKTSNEYHNLRRSTSPCKSSASNQTANNSSPNHLNSPCNRRRPTRHSPRLASSSRKISDFDNMNHYTAYDNQINYEEDMKKASIALEDMAQEINKSDDNELVHNQKHSLKTANGGTPPAASITSYETKSLTPYKNNKHLVKGLMTREFAGAFADEEIIFESIKNN